MGTTDPASSCTPPSGELRALDSPTEPCNASTVSHPKQLRRGVRSPTSVGQQSNADMQQITPVQQTVPSPSTVRIHGRISVPLRR